MIKTAQQVELEEKGIIFSIKRYSIHDGPGIRTTIFFKGCPITCLWCHNPEGISSGYELCFWGDQCLDCGSCIKACPEDAVIRKEGMISMDDLFCRRCGACVQACPTGAMEIIGEEMSVSGVMQEIEKDTIFYDESGGGVTFSGGEPLLQPEFLISLLMDCKAKGIHTAVDTCGFVETDILIRVSRFVDLFLYDIKVMDEEKHKKVTGVSNQRILSNLKELSHIGAMITVRIPVIPGFNDDDENMKRTGKFISSLKNIKQVDLLPFHSLCIDKYSRLGKNFPMVPLKEERAYRMETIKCILEKYQFDVVLGG
jgi:pyruvate formate lyase activating enzyme